jgi:hypothetical protein
MFSSRKADGRTCASDPFDEARSATRNSDGEQLHPSFVSHVIHVKLSYAIFCERQRTSRIQPEVIVEGDDNSPFVPDAYEQRNECQEQNCQKSSWVGQFYLQRAIPMERLKARQSAWSKL